VAIDPVRPIRRGSSPSGSIPLSHNLSLGGQYDRSIENSLHYVRDVTLGEDGCRVRLDAAPQILAGVRNAALHLLGRVNPKNIAAAIRHLAAKPFKAVRLVCPRSEN
jgi:hypothetical protein